MKEKQHLLSAQSLGGFALVINTVKGNNMTKELEQIRVLLRVQGDLKQGLEYV